MRIFNTWEKLLDSDFIVWAQVTKIEVIREDQYRTTFTILHTYKGSPPKELSFDWPMSNGLSRPDPRHQFSTYDIGHHYLLFAEKTNDGYSMQPERFMAKRYAGNEEFQEISIFYIKDLPPDLENRVVVKTYPGGDTKHRYLMWDDVKTWLDVHFKN